MLRHDDGARRRAPPRRPAHRPPHRDRACRCPQVRAELRRIDDLRNVGTRRALLGPGARHDRRWPCGSATRSAYVAAFVLMGPAFARFAILGHEAAHKLLFTQQAGERRRRPLGRRLPGVRAARRLPPRPLRPPQGRVRAQRARPQPLQRLPDHRGQLPAQAVARRPRHLGLEEPQGPPPRLHAAQPPGRSPCASLVDAGPAHRRRGRRRPLVAVPAALARAVDDGVAGHQPAALDRRARRHDALEGPAADHPPRRSSPGWPASGWCRSTPGGTSPTTSTWACRGATSPRSTPSSRPPATSPPELTYPSYRALWRALRAPNRPRPPA